MSNPLIEFLQAAAFSHHSISRHILASWLSPMYFLSLAAFWLSYILYVICWPIRLTTEHCQILTWICLPQHWLITLPAHHFQHLEQHLHHQWPSHHHTPVTLINSCSPLISILPAKPPVDDDDERGTMYIYDLGLVPVSQFVSSLATLQCPWITWTGHCHCDLGIGISASFLVLSESELLSDDITISSRSESESVAAVLPPVAAAPLPLAPLPLPLPLRPPLL